MHGNPLCDSENNDAIEPINQQCPLLTQLYLKSENQPESLLSEQLRINAPTIQSHSTLKNAADLARFPSPNLSSTHADASSMSVIFPTDSQSSNELQQQIAHLQSQLSAAQETIKIQESGLAKAHFPLAINDGKQAFTLWRTALQTLAAKHNQLKVEHQRIEQRHKENIKEMQVKIDELTQLQCESRQNLNSAHQRIAELEHQNSDMTIQNQTLSSSKNALQHRLTHSETRLSDLSQLISKICSKCSTQLNQQHSSILIKLEEMDQRLSFASQRARVLFTLLGERRNALRMVNTIEKAQNNRLSQLTQQPSVETLRVEISRLQSDREVLVHQLELVRDQTRLVIEQKDLAQSANNREKAELRHEIDTLRNEIEQLKLSKEKTEQQKQREIEEIKDQSYREVAAKTKQLTDELQQTQTKLEQLQREHTKSMIEQRQLQRTVERLQLEKREMEKIANERMRLLTNAYSTSHAAVRRKQEAAVENPAKSPQNAKINEKLKSLTHLSNLLLSDDDC